VADRKRERQREREREREKEREREREEEEEMHVAKERLLWRARVGVCVQFGYELTVTDGSILQSSRKHHTTRQHMARGCFR
jgi:hypothetical protein